MKYRQIFTTTLSFSAILYIAFSSMSSPVLLVTVRNTSNFTSFGADWMGNTPLLRELLTEICSNDAVYERTIRGASFCFEYEHSLVLADGRDLPPQTPYGKVVSTHNRTYKVRTAICDLSRHDVVVQYSMANVVNFQTSGLFSPSLLHTMVYVPALEYAYDPFHPHRDRVRPITTFNDVAQPRRKDLLQRLWQRGIPATNHNNIVGRDSMMALYDSAAIMINVHQTPHHHTLEEFRVLPALLRGVVVVCESSPLVEHIPYGEFLIWSPMEGMEAKVSDVIANYDVYFDKLFGQHSLLPGVLQRMRRTAYDSLQQRVRELVTKDE